VKREVSETPDLRASSSPASHLGGASAQSETSRAAAASPSGSRAESVPAAPRVAPPAALADSKPQVTSNALGITPHGHSKLRAVLLLCLP